MKAKNKVIVIVAIAYISAAVMVVEKLESSLFFLIIAHMWYVGSMGVFQSKYTLIEATAGGYLVMNNLLGAFIYMLVPNEWAIFPFLLELLVCVSFIGLFLKAIAIESIDDPEYKRIAKIASQIILWNAIQKMFITIIILYEAYGKV